MKRIIAAAIALGAFGCAASAPSKIAIVHTTKTELTACSVKKGDIAELVQKQCGEPAEKLKGTNHAECWIYNNLATFALREGVGGDRVAVCLAARKSGGYTREGGGSSTSLKVASIYGLRGAEKPAPKTRVRRALPLPPPPPPPPPPPASDTE